MAGGAPSRQKRLRGGGSALPPSPGLEANGAKLATFIATGVRQHYGNRSEKLTEFGLRPFRGGRRRVIKPPVPEAAKVEPADDPQP